MKKILFASVVLVLMVVITSSGIRHKITEVALNTGLFDSPPPTEIRGPQLTDAVWNHPFETFEGEPIRLSDFKGDVIMLTYWASWCGTCRKTNPTIQTLSNELSEREDIMFLFISMDNVRESAVRYMEQGRFSLLNVFTNDIPATPLNQASIPTTYVIDRNGKVVFRHTGYSNFSRRNFKEWLVEVAERE